MSDVVEDGVLVGGWLLECFVVGGYNFYFIVFVVLIVIFMEVFDIIIVNVLLCYIVGSFVVGIDESIYVIISYFVVNVIVLLILGWFFIVIGCK